MLSGKQTQSWCFPSMQHTVFWTRAQFILSCTCDKWPNHTQTCEHNDHVGLIEQVSTADFPLQPWLLRQYFGLIWIKKSANICWTVQANVQSAAPWHRATTHLISIPDALPQTCQNCSVMWWKQKGEIGGGEKENAKEMMCFYTCRRWSSSIQPEKIMQFIHTKMSAEHHQGQGRKQSSAAVFKQTKRYRGCWEKNVCKIYEAEGWVLWCG